MTSNNCRHSKSISNGNNNDSNGKIQIFHAFCCRALFNWGKPEQRVSSGPEYYRHINIINIANIILINM